MRKFNRLRTNIKDEGLALIELLLGIAIFGIVAAIAASTMSHLQKQAKAKAAAGGNTAPIDDVTSSSAVSGGFPLLEVLATFGLIACVVICVVFAVRARSADGSTGAHRGEQVADDEVVTDEVLAEEVIDAN